MTHSPGGTGTDTGDEPYAAPSFRVRLDLSHASSLAEYLRARHADDVDEQVVAWLYALIEEIERLRAVVEEIDDGA